MRASATPLVILALGVAACSGPDPDDDAGTTTMLIDNLAWSPVDAADDPYRDRRPPAVICPFGQGYQPEEFGGEQALDVYSSACNWLSVSQPLPVALPAGAQLKLRLWHFELTAPEPAVATLAVAIDGEPMWSTEVAIPGPGALVLETWALPRAVPAGAPIVFHFDNHGLNAYVLLEISATF